MNTAAADRRRPGPNALSKLHVGMIIMAITISLMVLMIVLRISYNKKVRRDIIFNFNDYDDYWTKYPDYHDIKPGVDRNKIYNILRIKEKIKFANAKQKIVNDDYFGPIKQSTFVIVVQVRDEIAYLKGLLESLKYMMGITNCFLIFAHNHYDDTINNLIYNISFAKFTQIYYPFSTQLYPYIFPGDDPNFCTGDFKCEPSVMRVGTQSQEKHYWWWIISYVFENVRALRNHEGMIIFLEENQYVLNDFIYMVTVMETMMITSCPQCEMISLGSHAASLSQFDVEDGNLTICTLKDLPFIMGMAFNRSIWNIIKENAYHFCHFNDYRWDVSLKYVASKRPTKHFTVLSSDAPRVIRYRKCSGYIYCYNEEFVLDVVRFADKVKRGLYPRHVIIANQGNIESEDLMDTEGGFEDVRDQELCMYFIQEGTQRS